MITTTMPADTTSSANQILTSIPLGESLSGKYRSGIPFPRGFLKNLSQVVLVAESTAENVLEKNDLLDFFLSPLSQWDDGSYRWVLLGVNIQTTADISLVIYAESQEVENSGSDISFSSEGNNTVASFCADSQLSVSGVKPEFLLSHSGKKAIKGVFEFKTSDAGAWLSVTNSVERSAFVNPVTQAQTALEIVSSGSFQHPENKEKRVLFEVKLFVYSGAKEVELSVTLHNPNAAKHPNGLWDLGDDNSVLFDRFSLEFSLPEKCSASYQLGVDAQWQETSELPLTIEQFSSGGENWNSPVHVDKSNKVPFEKNGFTVTENNQTVKEGLRADPVVSLIGDSAGLVLYPPQFWQEFPKCIELENQLLRYDFFPETGYEHELQAGEKKTHKVILSLGERGEIRCSDTKRFQLPSQWLKGAGVVPFYTNNSVETEELAQCGVTGPDSFMSKREVLDEYGWRNFGDLYADHETAGYQGDDIFVSHYNNQYDPLYGFLKQYLVSNDSRWLALSSDLARHVKDIDIYHTENDKHEYNGGLFWHTDHYVKTCTATHRSFSQLQDTGVYEDHAGGGGPGGQHCYTTGLMLHYFLTGEASSKSAVLSLTHWVENFYDGRGTLFEWLLALKNRHAVDLKDHFNDQYPLDRGTGHLLTAFIDSYEVTGDLSYLNKAIKVIRHTIAPKENVNERGLENIEGCWFYTVFLQGVYRYLSVKEQLSQLDEDFYYARDSLLTFTQWMLENEYPYLEKPELLEFPNDTWTAQDLRKACVFSAAYYYSNGEVELYKQKAEFFRDYVIDKLNDSAEAQYTRIQVLVLQNKGVTDYFLTKQSTSTFLETGRYTFVSGYKKRSFWKGALCSFFGRLIKFSIREECRWLRSRMN